MRSFAAAACLCFAGSPALADVITVDDSGGSDFKSLPEAVAAAAPGDTLIVAPGIYTAFTLDGKPLTIHGIAPGQVFVQGESQVRNIAAPSMVVLCQLDFWRLALRDSTGPLVLDGVQVYGLHSAILLVQSCADVRAIASQVESNFSTTNQGPFSCAAAVLGGSRFEATQSLFVGNQVVQDQTDGWDALNVRGGSRARLAASSASGGLGGDEIGCFTVCCPGYYGGYGILVEEASLLRVSGQATDLIEGGITGKPWCGGVHTQNWAIRVTGAGSSAVVSGATLDGGMTAGAGGTGSMAVPPVPWLERAPGPPTVWSVQFLVHGEPGDVVTLFLGRSAVVVPLPGVEIEQLTSQERSVELGTIDSAGVVTLSMQTTLSTPKGFTFFGQARILRAGAELRTNSVPIVLR